MKITDADIARVLNDLAEARGPDKSFCPSEAARALSAEWRALMPDVRRVAQEIGFVATQSGRPVDILQAKGPIRLKKRS